MEFRPATLADYVALFPRRPRRSWKVACVQLQSGPAWTLWREQRPRLICGLYPGADGVLEAWLMMPVEIGLERATLRFLVNSTLSVFPDRPIIARIDDANRAGQRLAALAGFMPGNEFLPGTSKRTWIRPVLAALPERRRYVAQAAFAWFEHARKRDT